MIFRNKYYCNIFFLSRVKFRVINILDVCLKDFLEKVVVESEEYKNIDDVIRRYGNLMNIRKELAQKHEKKTVDLKRLTTAVLRRSKVINNYTSISIYVYYMYNFKCVLGNYYYVGLNIIIVFI